VRVLVTGANGFIGRAVCRALRDAAHTVRACVRVLPAHPVPGCELVVIGDINAETGWSAALAGVDAVVHLASRTHNKTDDAEAHAEHRRLNVDGSARLARDALEAGVQVFVYMSSIKVNGERSTVNAQGVPIRFTGDDPPHPITNYGYSKWQAEQVLHEILRGTAMRLVVLRPPLVYGPGQKGNLQRLMRATDKGIPLPFAGLENRRSLIDVDNLAVAVVVTLAADCTAAGTYTLADVDLSSADLIRAMATALGKRPRLFWLPRLSLLPVARIVGCGAQMEKITGTLIVDSKRIAAAVSWVPQRSLAESMSAAAAEYRAACEKP
jgi:nucleoside-diphosphate-sugar epimerase